MDNDSIQPRILLVTTEISLVPDRSGKNSDYLNCKSGGFAGFLCHWVGDLHGRGVDVHIAQPDYRNLFAAFLRNNPHIKGCRMPQSRVHLAQDRVFFYAGDPELNPVRENLKISLAFQREVIHQILPLVKPDLIHCHDWMCGLIPAAARKSGIPCIFTLQSGRTSKCNLSVAEDIGIDTALFWQHLFFDRFPVNYEETRETNAVDFLLSGVFAAHHVSVASPAVLVKIAESLIRFPEGPLAKVLSEKLAVDCNAATQAHSAGMQYIDLYERLLRRPLLETSVKKSNLRNEFSRHLNPFNLSSGMQKSA
jgi:starch synthase